MPDNAITILLSLKPQEENKEPISWVKKNKPHNTIGCFATV